MNNDSFVEEFVTLQEQNATAVQPVIRNEPITEEKDNMEITTEMELRNLYVDPVEKFMDEFAGSATELRGLFRVHTSTAVDSNLQQIICSTAKEWFEKTGGQLNLFGLEFSQDEQINSWVNRTEQTHRSMRMPLHVEGFMQINDTKKQFNFLKSLDIANINAEVDNLHPSTHEFWEREDIKKELMSQLKEFSRNTEVYTKQTN